MTFRSWARTTSIAPPQPDAQSALDRKFSRGVRDNVMAECLVQGVRLCAMVVLARALGAAEFGLFRVLIFVCMFSITPVSARADRGAGAA